MIKKLSDNHEAAKEEERKDKIKFNSVYNKYQGLINRTNSRKHKKATEKSDILNTQQYEIDMINKQIEIGELKEEKLKDNMEDVRREISKAKLSTSIKVKEAKKNKVEE